MEVKSLALVIALLATTAQANEFCAVSPNAVGELASRGYVIVQGEEIDSRMVFTFRNQSRHWIKFAITGDVICFISEGNDETGLMVVPDL